MSDRHFHSIIGKDENDSNYNDSVKNETSGEKEDPEV